MRAMGISLYFRHDWDEFRQEANRPLGEPRLRTLGFPERTHGGQLSRIACAEWYEYQGYLVSRKVLVGRRTAGGHECELDVVAFDPKTRRVVHIEPSMDAQSWASRTERYSKRSEAGCK